jgi:hypothetical protein
MKIFRKTELLDLEENIDPDLVYFKAVENGDMETVKKMVENAAKASGYTIKAYHVTDNEFNVFDIKKARAGRKGKGFYFSETTPYENRGKRIVSAYLMNAEVSQEPQKIFKNSDKMTDREYVVRDPNQIKLADPITRDDQGKPIPLSKRFDASMGDIRY